VCVNKLSINVLNMIGVPGENLPRILSRIYETHCQIPECLNKEIQTHKHYIKMFYHSSSHCPLLIFSLFRDSKS